MSELNPNDVTRLLQEVELQTPGAVDQLVGLVYSDLRKIAAIRMRSLPPCDSLQPTALVNEIFLKLFGNETPSWPDRRRFFHAASRAMRDILVDRARRATSLKRGGGRDRAPLDDEALLWKESQALLDLTEALEDFRHAYPRQCEVVDLKYFMGLTEDEIALVIDVSPVTVRRDWKFARSWLLQRLGDSDIQ